MQQASVSLIGCLVNLICLCLIGSLSIIRVTLLFAVCFDARMASFHLDIENTGSQPLASAFFKLPNLVCGRSEGRHPALNVEMCMVQHLSLSGLSVLVINNVNGGRTCYNRLTGQGHTGCLTNPSQLSHRIPIDTFETFALDSLKCH